MTPGSQLKTFFSVWESEAFASTGNRHQLHVSNGAAPAISSRWHWDTRFQFYAMKDTCHPLCLELFSEPFVENDARIKQPQICLSCVPTSPPHSPCRHIFLKGPRAMEISYQYTITYPTTSLCSPEEAKGRKVRRKTGNMEMGIFQRGKVKQVPLLLRATLFLRPKIMSRSCWDSNESSSQVIWSHFSRVKSFIQVGSRNDIQMGCRGPEIPNCWSLQVY